MGVKSFDLDRVYQSFDAITGIDEVGRGCLAGPVVVAALTWSPSKASKEGWFSGLGDSKVLQPKQRDKLYPFILEHAMRIQVAVVANPIIDQLNILRATLHGFELVAPEQNEEIPLLIDGNQKPPTLNYARTAVKGDSRSSAIAGAAVVAKVFRDHLMAGLDRHFPQFQFSRHKGYGTADHKKALAQFGPTAYHRKSFRPVSDFLKETCPEDEVMLATVRRAPRVELEQHWVDYSQTYQSYSRAGAKRITHAFQERGLAVMPTSCKLQVSSLKAR